MAGDQKIATYPIPRCRIGTGEDLHGTQVGPVIRKWPHGTGPSHAPYSRPLSLEDLNPQFESVEPIRRGGSRARGDDSR